MIAIDRTRRSLARGPASREIFSPMQPEIPHDLEALDDAALRDRIVAAIRGAGGFRGGAEALGVHPRALAFLVARRRLDVVGALLACEAQIEPS